MARKIALIGKAPDSRDKAPFDQADWEIWILNTLGFLKEVPRWDRQFELHDLELTKDPDYGDYYDWLKAQTRPVYLRDEPPEEFAGGMQFPLSKILEHFGNLTGAKYLTNTVSLMIALVAYEHDQGDTVERLGLYGINMAQHGAGAGVGNAGVFTSEYARQRPSVEYWLGLCEAKGIGLDVPVESDILKCPCVYGYHTTDVTKKMVARRKELQGRINHAQAREQQAHDEAVFLSGALEGMTYDQQWMPGGDV